MNKPELIHLHGLFYEVATDYRSTGDGAPDLRRYRSLGTRPTSIYHETPDHQQAVFVLATALTSALRVEAGAARSTADKPGLDEGAKPERPAGPSRIRP